MTASGTLARAFVRSVVHSPDFALINWSEVKCALDILYFGSIVVQRTFKRLNKRRAVQLITVSFTIGVRVQACQHKIDSTRKSAFFLLKGPSRTCSLALSSICREEAPACLSFKSLVSKSRF